MPKQKMKPKEIKAYKVQSAITRVENNPLIPANIKKEYLENMSLDNIKPEVGDLDLSEISITKKMFTKLIKDCCDTQQNIDFNKEQQKLIERCMQWAVQNVLENPKYIGVLIENAYGIRVEDQKQFFATIKNTSKTFNAESAVDILNKVNLALHKLIDKINYFADSDDKLDVAGSSQMIKNVEGLVKMLIPYSKIQRINDDTDEKLKQQKLTDSQQTSKPATFNINLGSLGNGSLTINNK